jgi:hypothetical protein
MSTKITYNGKTTELASGYIATIPCKDFKMATDVVVEAPESEGESAKLYGIKVTPTKDIQNIVPEGDFDGFDEVIVNPIPDEYVIPNLISKTITENGIYRASEDVDDSTPIGTWVLNDTATYGLDGTYTINGVMNYGKYQGSHLLTRSISNPVILIKSTGQNPFWAKNSDGSERCYYDKTAGWYCGDYTTTTTYKAYNPMLTINEVTDGDSNGLLTWLKANGKKTASPTTVDGYSEVIVNVPSGDVEEWDGSGVVIEEIASTSLITFTIDGTSYEAEDGMTWAEWVESDYNKRGCTIGGNDGKSILESNSSIAITDTQPVRVLTTDTIISNGVYYGIAQSGSGGSGGSN